MNLEESRKKIDITHLCRMNGKDLQGFWCANAGKSRYFLFKKVLIDLKCGL
jgi:hypothetical protein